MTDDHVERRPQVVGDRLHEGLALVLEVADARHVPRDPLDRHDPPLGVAHDRVPLLDPDQGAVLADAAQDERRRRLVGPREHAREPLAVRAVDVLHPEGGVRVVLLGRVPDEARRGGADVVEAAGGDQPVPVHEILRVLGEQPEALLALRDAPVHRLELGLATGEPGRHRPQRERDAPHLRRAARGQRGRRRPAAPARQPVRLPLQGAQRRRDPARHEERGPQATERDGEQHGGVQDGGAPNRRHRLVERAARVRDPAELRDRHGRADPALAGERSVEDSERVAAGERALHRAVLADPAPLLPGELPRRLDRDERPDRVEERRPARPGALAEDRGERVRVDRRGHDPGELAGAAPDPPRHDERRAPVHERLHERADAPLGAGRELPEVLARVERPADEARLGRGDHVPPRIEPAHVAHAGELGAEERELPLDRRG